MSDKKSPRTATMTETSPARGAGAALGPRLARLVGDLAKTDVPIVRPSAPGMVLEAEPPADAPVLPPRDTVSPKGDDPVATTAVAAPSHADAAKTERVEPNTAGAPSERDAPPTPEGLTEAAIHSVAAPSPPKRNAAAQGQKETSGIEEKATPRPVHERATGRMEVRSPVPAKTVEPVVPPAKQKEFEGPAPERSKTEVPASASRQLPSEQPPSGASEEPEHKAREPGVAPQPVEERGSRPATNPLSEPKEPARATPKTDNQAPSADEARQLMPAPAAASRAVKADPAKGTLLPSAPMSRPSVDPPVVPTRSQGGEPAANARQVRVEIGEVNITMRPAKPKPASKRPVVVRRLPRGHSIPLTGFGEE